jgi:hypothetical protein
MLHLEIQPNPWSCLASAMAMALGLTTVEFERLAGHDGSAIVFPQLLTPQCRRGFHIQEAVHVARKLGYSMTPFELMPQIGPTTPNPDGATATSYHVAYGTEQGPGNLGGNWDIFNELIATSMGIIECQTRTSSKHAIAYDHGYIFNPKGEVYPYMPLAITRVAAFIKTHRKYKHLHDDLISDAYLTLTKVVNSFIKDTAQRPTGKIVFEIDKRLSDFIDDEIGAGMLADRTIRDKRAGDQTVPHRLPMDINDPPKSLWHHADGMVRRKHIDADDTNNNLSNSDPSSTGPADVVGRKDQISRGDARQIVAHHTQPDTTKQDDLLDTILACCMCEEDEMIVHLRIKGYSDEEIGQQMNVSQQTVNLRRQHIEERFDERQKREDEEE